MSPRKSFALPVLLAVLLCACGGGGGEGNPAAGNAAPPPLLAGVGPSAAVNAFTAVGPTAAPAAERSADLLLSRLSVRLEDGASVDQFNAAARAVGATAIGFSRPGSPFATLIVPAQANGAALYALAERLRTQAGIAFAAPGRQMAPFILPGPAPASPGESEMRHLLEERFPAAWNAAFGETGQRLATSRDCTPSEATVVVADFFQSLPPDPANQLAPFAHAQRFGAFNAGTDEHGWQVAATLASSYDEFIPTGATALPDCADFVLVDLSGLTYSEIIDELRRSLAGQLSFARLILNLSIGFGTQFCGASGDAVCTPENLAATPAGWLQSEIEDRIGAAIQWAGVSDAALEERMLLVQAAGNGGLGNLYPGIRQAALASPLALATQLVDFDRDFAPDGSDTARHYWTSEGQPSLLLDLARFNRLKDLVGRVVRVPAMANLLLVGSATNPESGLPQDVAESLFSNEGSTLLAVGEHIVGLGTSDLQGTSLAAPQVSGLAAYLWSISELEEQPVSETATHFRATATPSGLIDAYAATLALDAMANLPTVGVREALLDVNGDDRFDELDLQRFAAAWGLGDPNTPSIPEARDYGRFDLNGDGATGGIPTAGFDLDRSSIIPGPAPLFGAVDKEIEGYTVSFNEAGVSDLQVLCYYAYSTLFNNTAEPSPAQVEARRAILGPDRCVGARMHTLFPAQVTAPAALAATVEVPTGGGQYAPAPNMLVTFTPSCGSVSPTSGRTDAGGNVATTVTPTGCSASVSVTAVASAEAGTAALAQQTVTASVGNAGRAIGVLSIMAGHTPGMIEAFDIESDGQVLLASGPISDAATVLAQVSTWLAGVSQITSALGIQLIEPASLSFSLGIPAASVSVSGPATGTCASTVNVTVGDVGGLSVGGCLGHATVSAGNVAGSVNVGGSSTQFDVTAGDVAGALWIGARAGCCVTGMTANVHVQSYGALGIEATSDSTVTVTGSLQQNPPLPDVPYTWLGIRDNRNLSLAPVTGGTINAFAIEANTFAAAPSISVGNVIALPGTAINCANGAGPGCASIKGNTGLALGSISLGNIDGDLKITDNRGFSNSDASSFAQARTVGGTTTVSGNIP